MLLEASKKPAKKFKKKILVEESDEEESDIPYEESDNDFECFENLSEGDFEELNCSPNNNDFVLVRFISDKTKKSVYYVGKILQTGSDGKEFQVFS